jgi:UDP-N-acetylglucosamine 4,6-dehydratase (inverting)
MEKIINNSSILITGGSGSFGHSFASLTLKNFNPKRLVIFSRDEMKQWEMAKLFKDDPRVRFFIGDVRDKDRLHRALDNIDYVAHAAATKIVPTAEYNPFECVKTNINGAMNLIDACIDQKVKKVVALSTDKASSPINLYGATKLASDKIFVAANNLSGSRSIKFSVVRYGNVMGSNGSVMPFFLKMKKQQGILPITSESMTRFNISLQDGVKMVIFSLLNSLGGEIWVPKIPSYRILDVANAICDKCEKKVVGIRPGEKIHEEMITVSDSINTYDIGKYYCILPVSDYFDTNKFIKKFKAKKVELGFSYNSGTNNEWETVESLKKLIHKYVKSQ